MSFSNKTPLHFVGIGGIGMSAIAEVLIKQGFSISGSDVAESEITTKLKNLGIKVSIGHREENFPDNALFVYSSAISKDNPEYQKAIRLRRPIMRRAEILADIMRLKKTIAVAGSHGKTTTSGMLATIFTEANNDPTFIIGGVISCLGSHAKAGQGDWLIAEADESDGTFLNYNPIYSIINNIDNDHLDHYKNFGAIKQAFVDFANKVPFYGASVINLDDPNCREILPQITKQVVTFGTDSNADYVIKNMNAGKGTFDLFRKGQLYKSLKLSVRGEHNIYNAAAACIVSTLAGINDKDMARALERFSGAKRRFETVIQRSRLHVVEDYAHHPTEIIATLKTAKEIQDGRQIIVYFEPHRYSRTKDCWREFLHCFNLADKVRLMPIYAASESMIEGITSDRLCSDINQLHPNLCTLLENEAALKKQLLTDAKGENLILILGAGSIGRKIREVLAQ